MSFKKLSFMLLSSLALAALLNGCGSSSKEGAANPGGVAKVDEATCRVCHSTSLDPNSATPILKEFLGSAHNTDIAGCQGCHGGGAQHNGVGPIPFPNPLTSDRCNNAECHVHTNAPAAAFASDFVGNCARCHTSDGTTGIHGAKTIDNAIPANKDNCVFCHATAAPQHGPNLVSDNNGVRAITTEFQKWSHHVTGVALNNAHCAACHLAGKVVGGQIVVDDTKHMAGNAIYLRNAADDSAYVWTPDTPNHTTMDNFCMGCHSATGATSPASVAIQALINAAGPYNTGIAATATNPFGDTISNRYDKMQRGAVVDVSGQFATGNYSHHAVKGKKYSGSTRTAGARQIVAAATFAGNSSASLPGVRETLKEGGVLKTFTAAEQPTVDSLGLPLNPSTIASFNLNTLYQTLTPAVGTDATLGDDSPLHCGDCHTVGQYAATGTVAYNNAKAAYPAYTTYNKVAIGAHGSNNEYMLRNSIGTDALHVAANFNLTATAASGNAFKFNNPGSPFIVCYNCHAFQTYGSVYGVADGPGHVGEYAKGNRCNGENNTFAGYTTGTLATYAAVANFNRSRLIDPTLANGGSGNGGGNIFAIQCMNCHNSGPDNKFGGIHGSKVQTYPDANNVPQPARRFLSGLGNWKHVPTGSVDTVANTVGVPADSGWEIEKARTGEGCYTLSSKTSASVSVASSQNASGQTMFGTWGACGDHGGTPAVAPATYVTGGDAFERKIIRPVRY